MNLQDIIAAHRAALAAEREALAIAQAADKLAWATADEPIVVVARVRRVDGTVKTLTASSAQEIMNAPWRDHAQRDAWLAEYQGKKAAFDAALAQHRCSELGDAHEEAAERLDSAFKDILAYRPASAAEGATWAAYIAPLVCESEIHAGYAERAVKAIGRGMLAVADNRLAA
jgi:hypothetical protein